jgi:hypothetical protein
MANNQFALEPAAVSCVASTAKTVVQAVAPTNQRVKLLGWGVAFDGVLTTGKPVAIRLLRQTTAGTMSALTPVNTNGVSETILLQATFCTPVQSTLSRASSCSSLMVRSTSWVEALASASRSRWRQRKLLSTLDLTCTVRSNEKLADGSFMEGPSLAH